MLDAYIIEEIKRQEEERRKKEDAVRPRLHIELPRTEPPKESETEADNDEEPTEDDAVLEINLA